MPASEPNILRASSAATEAMETVELPMPTVLIVGSDRVVRFADTHADYTTRTEVSEIVAALASAGPS